MKKTILATLTFLSLSSLLANITKGNYEIKASNLNLKTKNYQETKNYLNKIFSDQNLIVALKRNLGPIIKQDEQGLYIFQSDIDSVTKLYLYYSNIKNLTGINIFTNLNDLDVSDNLLIEDFTPIFSLTNLKSLAVEGNQINNLNSFVKLKKLETLNLSGTKNEIKDFTPLFTMKNLKYLGLRWDNFSNFCSLSGFNNLQELDLSDTNISDLSCLKNLTNLQKLLLEGDDISDFTPLVALDNLNSLYLNNATITKPQTIGKIKNLKTLELSHVYITDFSFLSSLKNLVNLNLNEHFEHIKDISFLSSLVKLKSLSISTNEITNIEPLSNLKNLIDLDLTYNNIVNTDAAWAPIHKLPHYNPSWDNANVRASQNQE